MQNLRITLLQRKTWVSPMHERGDRVITPGGPGEVISKRMSAPTFTEAEAYSVCLDSKKAESEKPPFPSYSGTTYPAADVQMEP